MILPKSLIKLSWLNNPLQSLLILPICYKPLSFMAVIVGGSSKKKRKKKTQFAIHFISSNYSTSCYFFGFWPRRLQSMSQAKANKIRVDSYIWRGLESYGLCSPVNPTVSLSMHFQQYIFFGC